MKFLTLKNGWTHALTPANALLQEASNGRNDPVQRSVAIYSIDDTNDKKPYPSTEAQTIVTTKPPMIMTVEPMRKRNRPFRARGTATSDVVLDKFFTFVSHLILIASLALTKAATPPVFLADGAADFTGMWQCPAQSCRQLAPNVGVLTSRSTTQSINRAE